MHRISTANGALMVTALTGLLVSSTAAADPLHKYFKEDTYWHHGSGWLYPRHVADFTLDGSPAQVDGNDDLSAIYVQDVKGLRRLANVDLYYPQSANRWAQLESAKAGVATDASAGSRAGECESLVSEKPFPIDGTPQKVSGVKVTFTSHKAGCTNRALYFMRSARWVISIRTTAAATDKKASRVFDAFVRALRWDSLDTDPLLRETIE